MGTFNAENEKLLFGSKYQDGRVNKVYYNSIYGDANVDQSCDDPLKKPCDFVNLPTISHYGMLSPDESEGYELPDPDYKKNAFVWVGSHLNAGEYMYRGMFQYHRAELICSSGYIGGPCIIQTLKTYNSDTPQLNDFNVTEESARQLALGRDPKFKTIGGFRSNHTRLNNDVVGLFVLQTIIKQQH
jgi:hypothetical protein